jgi:glycosyltransferase involved in cell wall biosynthesis
VIPTSKKDAVYLYVWSGDAKRALALAGNRYSGFRIEEFPHRQLREGTFFQRIRLFRRFRGRALVFFVASLEEFKHQQLIRCVHLLHRCQETVLCDDTGQWQSMQNLDMLRSIPRIAWSFLVDGATLAFWWLYLHLRLGRATPVDSRMGDCEPEVAYLIPSLASMGPSGGAISHIRGFLYGLKAPGKTCRVFTGTRLAQDAFENEIIPAGSGPHLFWEAATLSYNLAFARGVQSRLSQAAPSAFYQRHVPFAIAGALLSARMKIPLILEYNGPMGWIVDHWDPTPFRKWITLCEEVSLRAAARVVVVSEALRAELLERGIPAERIRVNLNGVDPEIFCPGPFRDSGREGLGVGAKEVLVGFAGSFSLWHGIEVLRQAILRLLENPQPCSLRFVLMGNGLLHEEMRSALAAHEAAGTVKFTGLLPSSKIVEYLDACDILVSPHIPMPDGSRFFGSPTKLFEYMAMGKAIVASRLEQIAEVLEDDRTACLVSPGNAKELADAILRLALDPGKRAELGTAAREAAIERYTWSRNVAWALSDMPTQAGVSLALMSPLNSSSSLP